MALGGEADLADAITVRVRVRVTGEKRTLPMRSCKACRDVVLASPGSGTRVCL